MLAFVQNNSDAAPSFQKTSGQQRGSPSGKIHFGAVAKTQKSLRTAACSARWQSVRVSTNSEGSIAVLLLLHTPLYYMGVSTVFVI